MNAIESRKSNSTQIQTDTANLIVSSVTKNTLKVYRHAALKLETWPQGRRLDDNLLATYITLLYQQGKSPATISLVVAAVKWTAQNAGQPPVVGETTNKTLRAWAGGWTRLVRRRARMRLCRNKKSIGGLRDSAMIRLMSDCLLRISEVIAINVDDLSNSMLMIRSSKTDQEGDGEVLYITSNTQHAIQRYRQAAGIHRGPLFRTIFFGSMSMNSAVYLPSQSLHSNRFLRVEICAVQKCLTLASHLTRQDTVTCPVVLTMLVIFAVKNGIILIREKVK